MRLYHPHTLDVLSQRDDISKRYSSSVWCEIFKWRASGQKHPKMFIESDYDLGVYMNYVYRKATEKGCNLDKNKIKKLSWRLRLGWDHMALDKKMDYELFNNRITKRYFSELYAFSDACSLYYKGVNIFPDLYLPSHRKYIPVESHKEIIRQCKKTLNKKEYENNKRKN